MNKRLLCILAATCLIGCSNAPEPPEISLHDAALKGDVVAVRQHIAAGTDVDEKAPQGGSSPLITAATFGEAEAAIALLEGGADPNFKNDDGSTPLLVAAMMCHPEIVQVLLDKGADRNLRNNYGATALDTVSGPFEEMKGIYEFLQQVLGPLGLKLDYERIKATRPKIAEMLR